MAEFIAPPCLDAIDIIHQDEHILLINKPSGLLSLSGKNPLNLDSVHHRLVKDFPQCTLVHRLDFGTSGVMLVAKNKGVNALLTKQFQTGLISKSYQAILLGQLPQPEGDIHLPIAKDTFPHMKVCHETGKPSHSHYQVIESLEILSRSTTRVRFTPITGRTHQLRLHSQQIGHPIIGCDLYHRDGSFELADRLMLHAATISFIHPATNKRMTISSPCQF